MHTSVKPYQLIFPLALVLLAVSFLPVRNTIDLHVYDTYYVIDHSTVFLVFSIFLLTIGLLGKITRKILYSRFMDNIHIVFTITAVLFVIAAMYYYDHLLTIPVHGREMNIQKLLRAERSLSVSVLVLVAVQLLFFINIFTGLTRKLKQP